MGKLTIVIGNKNYSSWSLRAWIALAATGAEFDDIRIPLDKPDSRARILEHSPAGKVPVLRDGALAVWESLAICEVLAERFPDAGLWPDDDAARAHARVVACEMHAGFAALRQAMPMNCRAALPGKGHSPAADADIARIAELWRECRTCHGAGGDFLFGRFGVADAMFAPVASRFTTYAVDLDAVGQAYVDAVMALPTMQAWYEAARAEPERIEREEL